MINSNGAIYKHMEAIMNEEDEYGSETFEDGSLLKNAVHYEREVLEKRQMNHDKNVEEYKKKKGIV